MPAENSETPGPGVQMHLLNQAAEQAVVHLQITANPILFRGQ